MGVVNPICDMGFTLEKRESSCDKIRISASALGTGLSDKARGSKGKREEGNMAKPACLSVLTSRIILLGILSLLKPVSGSKPLTATALKKRGEGISSFPTWLAFQISG